MKYKIILRLLIITAITSSLAAKDLIQVLKVDEPDKLKVRFKKGNDIREIQLAGIRVPTHGEVLMRVREMKDLSEKKKEKYRSMSSKHFFLLKKYVGIGDTLYIKDTGKHDAHGRPLVYVYLVNQKMLNLEILKKGYSMPVYSQIRDAKMKAKFKKAFESSLHRKKGYYRLWYEEIRLRDKRKDISIPYRNKRKLTVMTFNVENLFDTVHDKDKKDYQYQPISAKQSSSYKEGCMKSKWGREECLNLDWNKERLAEKMSRLARVIKQVNGGQGPDIMFMQEVENYRVLKKLNDEYLKGLNYNIVHVETRDWRGIDVAVLTKLRLVETPRMHEVKLGKKKYSRGIMEAVLYMPNREKLHVYALHFPAQFLPKKFRVYALKVLNNILKLQPKADYAIAAGDTNISGKEDKEGIFEKYMGKRWVMSHKIGCKKCRGTNYYDRKKSWSFFDVIFLSRNLKQRGTGRWQVKNSSVRIVNRLPIQNTSQRTPKRYKHPDFRGVSDHWPLALDLYMK